MENPNNILWISIIGAIISTVGSIATIFGNLYKVWAEKKKTNNEGESAIADAADSIANGAKISNDMLLNRLIEMETREKERETELELRERARDKREKELLDKVNALESSLTDWQDWARRLVHQVRSYGKEPVPFKVLPKTGPLDVKTAD